MSDIGKAVATLFWALLLVTACSVLVAVGAVLWAVFG